MTVHQEHGRPLSFGSEWQLSADMKYILVKAHQKKVHLFLSKFLYDDPAYTLQAMALVKFWKLLCSQSRD